MDIWIGIRPGKSNKPTFKLDGRYPSNRIGSNILFYFFDCIKTMPFCWLLANPCLLQHQSPLFATFPPLARFRWTKRFKKAPIGLERLHHHPRPPPISFSSDSSSPSFPYFYFCFYLLYSSPLLFVLFYICYLLILWFLKLVILI